MNAKPATVVMVSAPRFVLTDLFDRIGHGRSGSCQLKHLGHALNYYDYYKCSDVSFTGKRRNDVIAEHYRECRKRVSSAEYDYTDKNTDT